MSDLGKVTVTVNGTYDAQTSYEKLSIVRYNGATYVSKQTTQGNAPTNTTYWQLISSDGDDTTDMISDTYDATSTYDEGDIVIHEGGLYKANQDIDTAEAWTVAHWTSVTVADELSGKVDKDGSKVLTTNQVIITANGNTAPSDTTALWVYPAS